MKKKIIATGIILLFLITSLATISAAIEVTDETESSKTMETSSDPVGRKVLLIVKSQIYGTSVRKPREPFEIDFKCDGTIDMSRTTNFRGFWFGFVDSGEHKITNEGGRGAKTFSCNSFFNSVVIKVG